MATTTNYGWETPDDTDLVKDGAAAIRTLGSSIDTTTKNLNPETTLGDIAYRSATANTNTRLALGTAGQVLTVNSGATAPEWKTPAGGGGKVLQVVSATTTTETTIASTTLTDTTITATITPTLSTSKILVFVNSPIKVERSAARNGGGGVLLRGATTIMNFNANNFLLSEVGGGSSNTTRAAIGFHYLDSPATTSATTYKVQGKAENTANSGLIVFQDNSAPSTITLLEIGA